MKTTKHEPSNMGSKSYQIWSIWRHMHIENHAMINNLPFNHFEFHLNIMIKLKFVSQLRVKMQKFRTNDQNESVIGKIAWN